MAEDIRRVVDAHVHSWDPARLDWYPHLASEEGLAKLVDMPDVSAMYRKYDQSTYFAETGKWNVEKYVHVTAATGPNNAFIAETAEREIEAQSTGHPNAIIGGVDGNSQASEVLSQLDQQSTGEHFRGIRASGGMDHSSAAAQALLSALQERDLVYDLWIHPAGMQDVASALERHSTLKVVVEHTGWPLSEDADHVQEWQAGMARLAAVGERVSCKLSGLAMPLRRIDAAAFRPWIEYCIEVFGDDRCFFASNFPVDAICGSFSNLYGVYEEITAGLDAEARERLFASNVERVYSC